MAEIRALAETPERTLWSATLTTAQFMVAGQNTPTSPTGVNVAENVIIAEKESEPVRNRNPSMEGTTALVFPWKEKPDTAMKENVLWKRARNERMLIQNSTLPCLTTVCSTSPVITPTD